MIDFTKSFKKGLDLAVLVQQNKEEIKSVFDELNRQISHASDNKIQIQLVANDSLNGLNNLIELFGRKAGQHFSSIIAVNPSIENSKTYELARWVESTSGGYPCKIILPEATMISEDKTGLETNLEALLANPEIGKKLNLLMNPSENQEI